MITHSQAVSDMQNFITAQDRKIQTLMDVISHYENMTLNNKLDISNCPQEDLDRLHDLYAEAVKADDALHALSLDILGQAIMAELGGGKSEPQTT